MKHTPTPWTANGRHIRPATGLGFIATCETQQSRVEEQYANAAFIVQACNAHKESVSTLREVLDYLHNGHVITAQLRDRIVAAIAAAEGSAQ